MPPVKHGQYINGFPTKLYRRWLGMRNRCKNPKHDCYHRYGGRGIQVCERWDDFLKFKEDMGEPPGPGYTLDRYPNPDGNYEPGNVRWATDEQQGNNKTGIHPITLPDGRVMSSVAMAARELGMSYLVLKTRIGRGWSHDRIFDPINAEKGQFKKGENRNRYAKSG